MLIELIQRLLGKKPEPYISVTEVVIPAAVQGTPYQAPYENVLQFLKGYPVKGPSVQVLDVPKRGFNKTPKSFVSLDAGLNTYLRRLKVSKTRKEILEARMLAVNFLDQHSPGLVGISDSLVSNLESLILVQRRQGAKTVQKVSRKRRRK